MKLRLPPELEAELQRLANGEHNNLSSYIVRVLKAHVAAPVTLPPTAAALRALKATES